MKKPVKITTVKKRLAEIGIFFSGGGVVSELCGDGIIREKRLNPWMSDEEHIADYASLVLEANERLAARFGNVVIG